MDISILVALIQKVGCYTRLKPIGHPVENWSWIIEPVPGYIEAGGGPWPFREVEWIEINPVKEERIGRLVPPKIIDKTGEVEQALSDAGISYESIGGVIRVYV